MGYKRIQFHCLTNAVEGEGLVTFQRTNGLISTMIPVFKDKGQIHEAFALKLAKRSKPELNASFGVNESIPIEYSRTLEKYVRINGSDLIELPISEFDLPNKIILLGYIGPSEEDMYRTPLRFLEERKLEHDQPDTYGLVIIANQIRTFLNRK